MELLSYHQYLKTRADIRKKYLAKKVVAEYLKDKHFKNQAQRSRASNAYRETDAFKQALEDCLLADHTYTLLVSGEQNDALGKQYKNYLKESRRQQRKEQEREAKKNQAEQMLREFLQGHAEAVADEITKRKATAIKNHLMNGYHGFAFFGNGIRHRNKRGTERLNADNFDEYIDEICFYLEHDMGKYLSMIPKCHGIMEELLFWYKNQSWNGKDTLKSLLKECRITETDMVTDCFMDLNTDIIIADRLVSIFTKRKIIEYLQKNQRLNPIKKEIEAKRRIEQMMEEGILSSMPENIKDIYPGARHISRHFIIHAGPTNSGKTYQALKAFRNASGVYLGPLRLLASEVYEDTNRNGVICSLKTGEEEISLPGAKHCSQTIETADLHEKYEVAVIDEAQLIEDPQRGGAWSSAIMGIRAKEVHLCTAEYAVPILKKLIEYCGDTWELIRTERKTELHMETEPFTFPEGIQDGDALIVFSKAAVLACAAELQERKIPCSIIYGSLPYDVRMNEARRFLDQETKVVVSTDAIGMGLNLPVRRVVFLETQKFDGVMRRKLRIPEIQQIAGRAGRWGKFEEGYVNTIADQGLIDHAVRSRVPSIKRIRLGFPKQLITVPGKVSAIMERWEAMPCEEFFVKEDLKETKALCKELEAEGGDKELIFQMIRIPFNQKNAEVKALWKQIYDTLKRGEELELNNFTDELERAPVLRNTENQELISLETIYQKYDLMFYAMNQFGNNDTKEIAKQEIMHRKKKLSHMITEELKKQNLSKRICEKCGRELPWNHTYGVCERCYRNSWYN